MPLVELTEDIGPPGGAGQPVSVNTDHVETVRPGSDRPYPKTQVQIKDRERPIIVRGAYDDIKKKLMP
jgi:hypothetical protein